MNNNLNNNNLNNYNNLNSNNLNNNSEQCRADPTRTHLTNVICSIVPILCLLLLSDSSCRQSRLIQRSESAGRTKSDAQSPSRTKSRCAWTSCAMERYKPYMVACGCCQTCTCILTHSFTHFPPPPSTHTHAFFLYCLVWQRFQVQIRGQVQVRA